MLSLEYLFNGGLKAWFIDPFCGRGRIKRIVWNVCSLNERNICYVDTVFLFSGCLKQKGWLVTEQTSHWYMHQPNCTNKFILLQYRWYHRLSVSSVTATVAKKHCTSTEFYHTEITNKMQLCTRIYYSNVYQLLNRFRATHRSSSGAQKL